MSKSIEDTFISLLDKPEDVRRKIKRAVTDSDAEIRFDPENKPGVSNLLSIIAALSGETTDAVVSGLSGKGYGELKARAAECVIETLTPIQAEYQRIMGDKASCRPFRPQRQEAPPRHGRWTR
jgi:tryptophanyl-tRNA synthetase